MPKPRELYEPTAYPARHKTPPKENVVIVADIKTRELIHETSQRRVVTAGRPIILARNVVYQYLIIFAPTTNAGNIFIGDAADVTATDSYILQANAILTLQGVNGSKLWIDAATSGDLVSWIGAY
jgi:hypothetical protein